MPRSEGRHQKIRQNETPFTTNDVSHVRAPKQMRSDDGRNSRVINRNYEGVRAGAEISRVALHMQNVI